MAPLEQPEQWELLAGYVLEDLSPEEIAQVNQYLQAHPELATEVSRLKKTLALLPLSLPNSPPLALRSHLLNAAQTNADIRSNPSTIWNQPRTWLTMLASVAASLVIGVGFDNYRLRQELASTQATLAKLSHYQEAIALLRQPNNRLLNLRGTSLAYSSSGSLVIAPKSESAVLMLQDLAPLPKGKVYRMWAYVNGQKVTCAEFKPNTTGEVFLRLPLNQWANTTSVVVTLEPSQETLQPTGKMVMTGS